MRGTARIEDTDSGTDSKEKRERRNVNTKENCRVHDKWYELLALEPGFKESQSWSTQRQGKTQWEKKQQLRNKRKKERNRPSCRKGIHFSTLFILLAHSPTQQSAEDISWLKRLICLTTEIPPDRVAAGDYFPTSTRKTNPVPPSKKINHFWV
jgi:hypothetical protein